MIGLSAVGVVGDVFLKKAGTSNRMFLSGFFVAGLVLYSATAFGWTIAMKHIGMASVGAIYSVATILLLALSGVLFFGERLSLTEWAGIGLAICALFLLARDG